MSKYKTISEVSKMLDLVDIDNKKPKNYTLRYWEKRFKEIKPTILNKRRHYSHKQIELVKLIKFLIKDKGMNIAGVKSVLKSKINKLDDSNSNSLKAEYFKNNLNVRSKNILEKIKKIKKYGKKIPH